MGPETPQPITVPSASMKSTAWYLRLLAEQNGVSRKRPPQSAAAPQFLLDEYCAELFVEETWCGADVWIVRVEMPPLPATEAGEKAHVVSAGRAEQLKVTGREKPVSGVSVTAAVVTLPG
jgi:hypothetical protein